MARAVCHAHATTMDRFVNNPAKKKGLQTIFVCLLVCLFLMLGVGLVMYFINQDNELMPDSSSSNTLDEKH